MTSFVLADRHALFRSAVALLLEDCCGLTRAAEVDDADGAVAALRRTGASLLLVGDLRGDGIETCRRVRREQLDARVIVLGDGQDASSALDAVTAGADGFVDRAGAPEEVRRGIEQVLAGHAYVPGAVLGPLLQRLLEHDRESDRVLSMFLSLTRRERQIVELLVEGCDHRAVADILVISPETARTHIQNVLGKLGVHSRLEVVTFVRQHGLLDRLQRTGV